MAIPIINVSILNGSNGFRLNSEADERLGTSVSSAGDINGDGFDDVIIGAPGIMTIIRVTSIVLVM